MSNEIDQRQIHYFDQYFQQHGATIEGLNYGSKARQQLCFAQVARILQHQPHESFSLNDYGCGYGDLHPFLLEHGYTNVDYRGYDITPKILQAAKENFTDVDRVHFFNSEDDLPQADYTVAVGVFNIHNGDLDAWRDYVVAKLHKLWGQTQRGLAFNLLTSYSDADKMRDYLYYADPLYFFDYCKRNFSRNVALLHDYGVYEFTLLVRADS